MKIHEIFEHLTEELRSFMPDDMWPISRCVGIEVEVEGAGNLRSTRLWNVINDSSLRNDGRELVTKLPLAGYDLRKATEELDGLLRSGGLAVSERCSVHVHIDVRDLTLTQVGNILATYVACEAALYNFGGKERYDNIYCPGVTSALEQMGVMRRVMQGSDHDFRFGCHDWCKYTGINLRSIAERGSIEFRAHEGTLDLYRITEWVGILLRMVDYATTTERKKIKVHAKQGAVEFIARVFSDKAPALLQDGIYEELYKNNILNLTDLLDTSEDYSPDLIEGINSGGSDIDAVIAAVRAAIAERGE